MNTNATHLTQPTQPSLPTDGTTRQIPRVLIILLAFWAILCRDIVVTTRQFVSFLVQVLLQPLFLIFVFGKILPQIGEAQQSFAAFLLPGIVALSVILTSLQGMTLSLTLDLSYSREIDDRILAPLPVSLVALEKILFAVARSMIAGAIIFPLAYWILGSGYQVRSDHIALLIGIMLLSAFGSAALGLVLGTVVPASQINLVFTLVFTPLIFTGCVYYPWSTLNTIRWFQIVTLFNPLTYASEGLRYAMVPAIHGYTLPTLAPAWVFLGLGASCVGFLLIGIQTFYKRVVA